MHLSTTLSLYILLAVIVGSFLLMLVVTMIVRAKMEKLRQQLEEQEQMFGGAMGCEIRQDDNIMTQATQ
jgi:sulfite exporter TauE/SafE